jgi:hypothetical protein
MKKLVVLFVSVVFVLGAAVLVSAQTHKAPAHRMFSGTVDKVTPADVSSGTKAEIVLVGTAHKSMTFVVADSCTFYDAKGGTITFDKIVKGAGVRVTYTTNAQGGHQAVSIKLLK